MPANRPRATDVTSLLVVRKRTKPGIALQRPVCFVAPRGTVDSRSTGWPDYSGPAGGERRRVARRRAGPPRGAVFAGDSGSVLTKLTIRPRLRPRTVEDCLLRILRS